MSVLSVNYSTDSWCGGGAVVLLTMEVQVWAKSRRYCVVPKPTVHRAQNHQGVMQEFRVDAGAADGSHPPDPTQPRRRPEEILVM